MQYLESIREFDDLMQLIQDKKLHTPGLEVRLKGMIPILNKAAEYNPKKTRRWSKLWYRNGRDKESNPILRDLEDASSQISSVSIDSPLSITLFVPTKELNCYHAVGGL